MIRKKLSDGISIAVMMIFFIEGNSLVHIAMRKKEIPHEFRIRDGAHNWTYWRASLPKVLEFVSMGFISSDSIPVMTRTSR